MEARDYGPFPYIPITRRPKITWPNDAQLAVWVIPNIEFFSLKDALSGHPFEGKGPVPGVRAWSQRDYGNRVGICFRFRSSFSGLLRSIRCLFRNSGLSLLVLRDLR